MPVGEQHVVIPSWFYRFDLGRLATVGARPGRVAGLACSSFVCHSHFVTAFLAARERFFEEP
jgi:hypothetical protein